MATYSGKGIEKMMACAKKHGLTKDNSRMTIIGKPDFDAKWYIRKI